MKAKLYTILFYILFISCMIGLIYKAVTDYKEIKCMKQHIDKMRHVT